MTKRFFSISLVAILLCVALPVSAQSLDGKVDLCAYGWGQVLDRFLKEQKEFEPTIDILSSKPTIATEILVGTGVQNLRQYRARLQKICSDSAAYNREDVENGCKKKSEVVYNAERVQCDQYVTVELEYQQAVFEQLMLFDVTKKKVKYLTDKYKELNTKFAALLDLVTGVHNGLHTLNAKVQYVAEQCQE